jgi:hypothetical protein
MSLALHRKRSTSGNAPHKPQPHLPGHGPCRHRDGKPMTRRLGKALGATPKLRPLSIHQGERSAQLLRYSLTVLIQP